MKGTMGVMIVVKSPLQKESNIITTIWNNGNFFLGFSSSNRDRISSVELMSASLLLKRKNRASAAKKRNEHVETLFYLCFESERHSRLSKIRVLNTKTKQKNGKM